MAKKLTIEYIREQFEADGYVLLTEEYINNIQKLDYICSRGHSGNICWKSWQHGCRCAECAGNKRLTINFLKMEFKKDGCNLLTKSYINGKQKLEYICSKGHHCTTCWGDWRQGYRCSECAGLKKYTIDFIKKEFEKECYELFTKVYVNSKSYLDYTCPFGHVSKITWHDWKSGYRCKYCSYELRKGVGNPNWNPNLTDEERTAERNIQGYSGWSYAVKERDNFTCQVCGDNRGGNLVSHHLESYNSTPELRTELSNGVCLCKKCHDTFHNKYGRGNNTRKQFEEFSGTFIA